MDIKAEIKANELVEKFWIYALPNANGSWKNAIQCAIISQQREVDLLKEISLISYLPTHLLDEAQEVLTILKAM